MKPVMNFELWTDGSCNNNPKHIDHGIGAWAFLVVHENGKHKEIIHEDVGGEFNTTSSRMEQMAALMGLLYLKEKYEGKYININIYSDSEYVVKFFTERRFDIYIENRFFGIKNSDLWKKLLKLRGDRKFKMIFNHVKGHSGIELNERVDDLAGETRKYMIENNRLMEKKILP